MYTLQLNTSRIHSNSKKRHQNLSPSKVVTFLYIVSRYLCLQPASLDSSFFLQSRWEISRAANGGSLLISSIQKFGAIPCANNILYDLWKFLTRKKVRRYTLQKKEVYAWWNVLAKRVKLCHIFGIHKPM